MTTWLERIAWCEAEIERTAKYRKTPITEEIWKCLERLRQYETEAAAVIAPQMTDEGLRARLEILEADVYEATGELLVPLPEPRTPYAIVMAVNRLLKGELMKMHRKQEQSPEDEV